MNRSMLWFMNTLVVAVSLTLSACVMIHSGSISESAGGGSPVAAAYSDYGFLHLTAPATLTAGANKVLASQCQSGMLSDVQTELAMRDWFAIVQYYTVSTAAVCK